MIPYDINLKITHNYADVNETYLLELENKLNSISNFEKKLVYFNKNVKSLAFFGMNGRIYLDKPENRIKIYCGCTKCRNLPDFNSAHEEVFFKLRKQEEDRILSSLGQCKNYKEQWSFFLTIPGYNIRYTPFIAGTVLPKKGETPMDIDNMDDSVNLRPRTQEEQKVYNKIVIEQFNEEFRLKKGFTKVYGGFNFEREKAKLMPILKKSLDPDILVKQLINRIEEEFEYPESKPEKQPVSAAALRMVTFKKVEIFQKLAHGIDINLDERLLSIRWLEEFEHVGQIYQFYKFLRNWNKDLINDKPILRTKNKIRNENFTMSQVALIYIYNEIIIPDPRSDLKKTADKIAHQYNFTSPTSGSQLYTKFNKLDGGSNQRTGVSGKKRMIADIQKILPELKNEAKKQAEKELKQLIDSISKE